MIRKLGHRIPQDIAVAGTSVADIPVDAGINQRGEPSAPCRILVESTWQDGKFLPCRL